MNTLSVFLKGWALLARHPLYLVLKWLLNLVFALLLLAPLAAGLNRFLDHRAAAENFVFQPSMAGIYEFMNYFEPEMQGMTETWFVLLAFFAVLNIVLTAGYLNVFAASARGEKGSFRSGMRRHFLPLALTPILFVALLYFGVRLWERFTSLDLPLWSQPVTAVLALWLFWLTWLVYDYTRVAICARPATPSGSSVQVVSALIQPIIAFFRALAFVLRKPGAWILALMFLLIQAVWIVGMQRGWFGDHVRSTTIFALLMGQLLVLARTATGLAQLAAETVLWVDGHQTKPPHPVPEPETDSMPFTQPPEPDETALPYDSGVADQNADESGMLGDDDEQYLLAGRRGQDSD